MLLLKKPSEIRFLRAYLNELTSGNSGIIDRYKRDFRGTLLFQVIIHDEVDDVATLRHPIKVQTNNHSKKELKMNFILLFIVNSIGRFTSKNMNCML